LSTVTLTFDFLTPKSNQCIQEFKYIYVTKMGEIGFTGLWDMVYIYACRNLDLWSLT